MLGNAAGLVAHHIGLAQGVEQGRLAVVHMTHNRHHRRPRLQILLLVRLACKAHLHVGRGNALQAMTELLDHQLGGIGVYGLVDRRHDVHLH